MSHEPRAEKETSGPRETWGRARPAPVILLAWGVVLAGSLLPGCGMAADRRLAGEPLATLALDEEGAILWFRPGALGRELLAADPPTAALPVIRSLLDSRRTRPDGLRVADYAALLAARAFGQVPDLRPGASLEVRSATWTRWAERIDEELAE